jgi:hypothetical protein
VLVTHDAADIADPALVLELGQEQEVADAG